MEASRIRVLTSSVLMTASWVALLPFALRLAGTWREEFFEVSKGNFVQNYWMPMGFASLALICAGLVVIWTGFQNRLRSAWLILFLIAWLFYFPVFMFPQLKGLLSASNWLSLIAISRESDMAIEQILARFGFLLILFGLCLPIGDFFGRGSVSKSQRKA